MLYHSHSCHVEFLLFPSSPIACINADWDFKSTLLQLKMLFSLPLEYLSSIALMTQHANFLLSLTFLHLGSYVMFVENFLIDLAYICSLSLDLLFRVSILHFFRWTSTPFLMCPHGKSWLLFGIVGPYFTFDWCPIIERSALNLLLAVNTSSKMHCQISNQWMWVVC